jgi:hypothetical protein
LIHWKFGGARKKFVLIGRRRKNDAVRGFLPMFLRGCVRSFLASAILSGGFFGLRVECTKRSA